MVFDSWDIIRADSRPIRSNLRGGDEMSSLRRWEPFRGLMRMQRDLDRVFDDVFGAPWRREGEPEDLVRIPSVDVSETDEEVVVRAELPGVGKDDLEVEALPESLAIKAETSEEQEEKEATYHRRERVWRRYERVIPLPAEIANEGVKAKLQDGVLEVRAPKAEPAKARGAKKVKIE